LRHKTDKTEQNFFDAFMSDEPMNKAAIDLDPSVADALGIPTVSPMDLDDLENGASTAETAPQSDADQPALDEQPAADSMDVGAFDAVDLPPADEEDVPQPELPTRTTHGRLFGNKRASPLQILDVLTMRYNTEWSDWESDTLWWALRRDFGPVGELTRNKIGALRVAVTSDAPWLDWDVFEDCGLAWNDVTPIIGAFQPMTPMQMAFAVSVLHEIRSDEQFDTEVKAYIASILEDNGWVFAPPEFFDGAQELLDRKVWLVGFRQQVMAAWERVKDVDPSKIEWDYNSPLDIHLLKLLTVKHYVAERAALREKVPGMPTSTSTAQPPVP
jgi:hypothetical protein